MEWYEYFIIGIAWMLIPLGILINSLQKKKLRRWQKEDQQKIIDFIKGNIK